MLNKKHGLSKYRQEKIMRAVCADLAAAQTAHLLTLYRKTVNRYDGLFRAAIFAHQTLAIEEMIGTVECDESYFGADRVRGKPGPRKRGRGTKKQAVFGVFERGGRVFTE